MAVAIAPKINEARFYEFVRVDLFNGRLTHKQVEGMNAIIREWQSRPLCDIRWLAYMYATVYHETARTMQPIAEYGKGAGRVYGRKIKMSRKPYTTPNQIYYGRGFVQLTWYENYEIMGKRLKVDLLNNPDLALNLTISTQILFEGMLFGLFTGRKLADYFIDKSADYINARKIINGLDKAHQIAEYALKFHSALKT